MPKPVRALTPSFFESGDINIQQSKSYLKSNEIKPSMHEIKLEPKNNSHKIPTVTCLY